MERLGRAADSFLFLRSKDSLIDMEKLAFSTIGGDSFFRYLYQYHDLGHSHASGDRSLPINFTGAMVAVFSFRVGKMNL